MADVKLQVYRGPSGPDKVDFRKSTGGFLGSPDDEHRTVLEYRADAGATEIEALSEINELLARMTENQPGEVAKLAEAFGLDGDGPVKLAFRLFDND